MVFQKAPRRAKGVWLDHSISDVWQELPDSTAHPHSKPIGLQTRLIQAVSAVGDLIVDPTAGSYSVLESALSVSRHFLGSDLIPLSSARLLAMRVGIARGLANVEHLASL
jgi:site-specific DNA-methyltransferase (adenine-specific)